MSWKWLGVPPLHVSKPNLFFGGGTLDRTAVVLQVARAVGCPHSIPLDGPTGQSAAR